jgi:hypothetical protein
MPVGEISIFDHQTTNGNLYPILPNVIGIDIISQFDLLFEEGMKEK